METIENNKLCLYCMGCLRLENPLFKGVMSCKNFIQCKDMTEYYKKLTGGKK